MKLISLWRVLIFVVIIMIIIGGSIIIIIIREPIPPDTPPGLIFGSECLKYLGITDVVLGMVCLGLISKIKNHDKF
jgi:hypothetical protein